MQRENHRSAFRRLATTIALGGVAGGSMLWSDTAYAQLRTGREGQREFYREVETNPAEPAKRTASVAKPQAPPSKIEGSRVPKRLTPKSPVTTAHAPAERSDVVTASAQEWVEERVVDSGKWDDGVTVVTEEGVHVVGADNISSCDSCGCADGDCGCDATPHINIRFAFPFARALSRVSARIEAATFYGSDQVIPGLVRTAAVGTAGSTDLFGGTVPMDETVQGFRGELGWLFGHDECTSLQVRFFDTDAQALTFNSAGSNAASIVRPYFDPVSNQQESISIIESGVSTGSVLAHATSSLYGGDLLLKQLVHRSRYGRMELLAGFQTAQLADSIAVNSTTVSTTSGDVLTLQDRFDTGNRFYGGTLGLSAITYTPCWSLSGMFKLGMGNMQRYVGIDGFQEITVGPPPVSSASEQGLLARSTNIGTYNNLDTFIVSPELNVTLGYRLTKNLEATVGYNYLVLPKVARASDQLDPRLAANLSNPLVGAARPSFNFVESNYALHSLNYGLQFRY